MEPRKSCRRFSLLIGIDLYLSGRRTDARGNNLQIPNLSGCANDARAIEKLLRNTFQVDRLCTLTSTPSSDPTKPHEPPDQWPTFENIRKEFRFVKDHAQAGDLFLFYFSGHGKKLARTSKSPPGREVDPSLLPMDFGDSQPALRGWQLNEWLKKLNEKDIHVLVTLDSCYSGGSFRNDDVKARTPKHWGPVPTLQVDEDAIEETASEPNYRDGELVNSWDINPRGFTVMTACEADQLAKEDFFNGNMHGVFTGHLLQYFQKNHPHGTSTPYYHIRDQLAVNIKNQTPRVYGQDKLLFFEKIEPFFIPRLVCCIEDDVRGEKRVIIPMGEVHGVKKGVEFTSCGVASNLILSVSEVHQSSCRATISIEESQQLQKANNVVIIYRWCIGAGCIRVVAGLGFDDLFKDSLRKFFHCHVVDSIDIVDYEESRNSATEPLRLERGGSNCIDIFGSESVIGYTDAVRGLDLRRENSPDLIKKSAAVLSHLMRFRQILRLRDEWSGVSAPLQITWSPIFDESNDAETFSEGQKFKIKFTNTGHERLYVTVMVLSAGFHVKQIYPSHDVADGVDLSQGASKGITLKTSIPDELKTTDTELCHRDIIRTIITRGRALSWRGLELPDIWHMGQLSGDHPTGCYRNVEVVDDDDPDVWICDRVVRTRRTRPGD